jgi:hypothetical protein
MEIFSILATGLNHIAGPPWPTHRWAQAAEQAGPRGQSPPCLRVD